MLDYNSFTMPEWYLENVLNMCKVNFVNEYYEKQGMYPTPEEVSAVVLSNEQYELFKKRYFSLYLAKNDNDVKFEGAVVLPANYSPAKPVVLANTVANVNLNGKVITGPIFAEKGGEVLDGSSDSYAFWVKPGAELTIEGDGEVVAQPADYSMAVWANGGNVTINGGKFYNNGDNSDLIYASDGSQVEIYGGEFHANENKGASGTKNRFPALNIKDAHRATTSIKVYGGKFYGFDPANNLSEGPNTNFVAPGYKSVEVESNVWEVVAE